VASSIPFRQPNDNRQGKIEKTRFLQEAWGIFPHGWGGITLKRWKMQAKKTIVLGSSSQEGIFISVLE
jgi:hypothetical protein